MIALSLESVRHWKLKVLVISFLADRWHLMITLIMVVGQLYMVMLKGLKFVLLIFVFLS